ncbi:molybdopterin synthase catalytic subunit MoaE [Candidatus Ishikawella capsulata]|uniref:Molybdopterin synthase catalytic subunit n=1 Tax=Candidatus Ishikawaella capsulata Mpkobe TaxID=476281 RepID=C5WDB8_9ENTR|nr:molybdopterin synthase catalytic subunit MoaE [Candidatus Ishikawaella capsulata]BAH83324.1 molybdopterin synthase large subunit [Candidatus Ishikawaella capsulata Mpkobe]
MEIKICVGNSPFNICQEYQWLNACDRDGAVVTFTGKVRSHNDDKRVLRLTLEHYPEMTEKILKKIIIDASYRWILHRIIVIHRIGELSSGDNIVLVGVSCLDRSSAFSAAEFIMDHIKTHAPFWKKEATIQGNEWISMRIKDIKLVNRWNNLSR